MRRFVKFKALVLLLSKLSSVTGLPSDARTPEVRTSNSDDSPIARLALVGKPGKKVDLEGLGNFLETQIVEPLGRVSADCAHAVRNKSAHGTPMAALNLEDQTQWNRRFRPWVSGHTGTSQKHRCINAATG